MPQASVTCAIEVATLPRSSAAAMQSMPALVTRSGPKRSASMPAKAPSTKYSSPEKPNTSETCARLAWNSSAKGSKKAANEYETPKITASAVKQAQTTTQPRRGSSSMGVGGAAVVGFTEREATSACYPFVFSSSDDGQRLTLCIDEACPSVNRQERGSALFGADGQPTAYLESVLAFTTEYQRQDGRTRALCRRLRELGLLTPMQASAPMPSGEDVTLSGFLAVDRARVRDLDAASLQALARDDELEPLFLHLASLRNFERIKDRMVARAAETQAPAAAKRAAPRKRAKPRAP
jgi:hypothetical protein